MNEPDPTVTVTINDLSRGGAGVGKLGTGEIVFVPFTVPGDEVKVKITKKSKTYSQGELIEIIKPSPSRLTPPCPVFTKCGGCSWQHVPYPLQFETKKKGLLQSLKRTGLSIEKGTLPEPELLPAKTFYHYRNRIQLRGDATGFGYYERGSNETVSIDQCEIAHPKINAALAGIKNQGFKDFGDEFKVEVELDEQGEVRVAWNQRNAAFGFRQINSEQNELLKIWVKEAAISSLSKSKINVLFDLYGGDGNLSQQLASSFSEIHCVDLSVPSEKPTGTPGHFYYHQSGLTRWLKGYDFKGFKDKSFTLILDPPREGLTNDIPQILQSISKMSLNGIILVGCDVDSFTKDLTHFIQKDFGLKKLAVLDLFPQTPHVESLALLLPSALL